MTAYLWTKTAHLLFVMAWVAAVFYLIMTAIASWLLGRFAKHMNVETQTLGSTSDAKMGQKKAEA